MLPADLMARGAQTMTVCNSCRYCEQYCPVFPAMERRTAFGAGDLTLLASLCHNCGECLYACQYAPPHAFGIDVPRLFAEIRLAAYEHHAWPRGLSRAFRRQGTAAALVLVLAFTAVLFAATAWLNPGGLTGPVARARFYDVVPHGVMVGLFGAVGGFVLLALTRSVQAYRRGVASQAAGPPSARSLFTALRDGVSLRHLHGTGIDCVSGEEAHTPWRRWAHHATLGGFGLCFASTAAAAVYHQVFGWEAPYGYASVPVVLGTVGGIGLVVGPIAQWWQRARRDPALATPKERGLDRALLLLLALTSVTGLLLLALREQAVMPALLIVHLATVLALFVTLPYGMFVHGFYRLAALAADAAEREAARGSGSGA
jgi:citrate/tricarballylate utilization protein